MEAAGVEPALAGCKYRCAAFNTKPPIWAEEGYASSALFLIHDSDYEGF